MRNISGNRAAPPTQEDKPGNPAELLAPMFGAEDVQPPEYGRDLRVFGKTFGKAEAVPVGPIAGTAGPRQPGVGVPALEKGVLQSTGKSNGSGGGSTDPWTRGGQHPPSNCHC